MKHVLTFNSRQLAELFHRYGQTELGETVTMISLRPALQALKERGKIEGYEVEPESMGEQAGAIGRLLNEFAENLPKQ